MQCQHKCLGLRLSALYAIPKTKIVKVEEKALEITKTKGLKEVPEGI